MMRRRRTGILVILADVVVVVAAGVAVVWRPSIARETTTPSFPPQQVTRGAALAAVGNCITCHTKSDGIPFAGGRPIETPFGTIYSVNVTPDHDTGIGGWSEAAFRRAMKDGVSRDGHHLYPAFPYDHMTRMSDDDIASVYAFMMTRRPVHAEAPSNDLPFPFNLRPLIAGWKLLFLDRDATQPDTAKGPEWNRGAYLVEGLAHCGACHTPRNALGAEKTDEPYAGGESDGWIAPALNAASPAAVPWDAARLYNYLRHGFDAMHCTASPPVRWRRWSRTSMRRRTRTCMPSRPMWPTSRVRRPRDRRKVAKWWRGSTIMRRRRRRTIRGPPSMSARARSAMARSAARRPIRRSTWH
jgi:mono/diheme cytochrome c family protein